MTDPQPTNPLPIYGRKVEVSKLYINGKEYPYYYEVMHGELDVETGELKLFKENKE